MMHQEDIDGLDRMNLYEKIDTDHLESEYARSFKFEIKINKH